MSDFTQQIESWLAAQQQFWQQMLSHHSATTAEAATPQAMVALLDRLSSQADAFQRFGESLLKQPSNADPDTLLDNFVSYIQQQHTDLILRRWQLPEALITLYKLPLVREAMLAADTRAQRETLLQASQPLTPPDVQVRLREGHQLLDRYQQALRHYLAQYEQIIALARTRLRQDLSGDAPAPGLDSLAALHQRWAEHYDDAYQQAAFGSAYPQAHSDLANSLMRLQQFAQQWRDEQYAQAGLVNLTLFDQLLKQQTQLRKTVRKQRQQNAQLQQQLADLQQQAAQPPCQPTLSRMQQQIDQLQQQLDALQKNHQDRP